MSTRTDRSGAAAVQAIVLRSAGTNCDGETVRGREHARADVARVHRKPRARDPARHADERQVLVPGGINNRD
jgi:phosphoribosylformylglycinamidine (FGAM) synthase-like amidotransferase family enzyme